MKEALIGYLRSGTTACWIVSFICFVIAKTDIATYLVLLGILNLLLSWEFSDQPEDDDGENETH